MNIRSIFVSDSGDMLERWLHAFPTAAAVRSGSLDGKHSAPPEIVWLRMASGDDAAVRCAAIRQRWKDVPVIVLAEVPDDDQALACFSQGARGYCNCHAQPALLRNVAEVVRQGGLWLGESLMARLLKATSAVLPVEPSHGDWAQSLTDREREVARAVAAGAANKEIARQLGITERTVKAHTGAIFQKLGVRDRLQLSLLIHRGSKN
jgi:DNA-binding NarL/FixJ family response regulator